MTETEICMILDTYMYFDYQYAKDSEPLSKIIEGMEAHPEVITSHPNEYEILSRAVKHKEIGDLKIVCQSSDMGFDSGTNAAGFVSKDNKTVYIAFRGTADGEWYDNGDGMTAQKTTQQKSAVSYFEKAAEKLQLGPKQHVVLTGHSKGGNKVQYITMETPMADVIDRTYSIDGQGHSDAALKRWNNMYTKEEFDSRVSKIYAVNGQNDFVSVLGLGLVLKEHISYVETPAGAMDFVTYHDITGMFKKTNVEEDGAIRTEHSCRKNPNVLIRGKLSECVAALSANIMSLPQDERAGSALTLMQSIEFLNGGMRTGVNGETIGEDDIKTFVKCGVPAITKTIFGKDEGIDFVKGALTRNGYAPDMPATGVSIRVDYAAMEQLAQKMMHTSVSLHELTDDMINAVLHVPLIIDGVVYKQGKMLESIEKLRTYADQMKKLAAIQLGAANIYRSADSTRICF